MQRLLLLFLAAVAMALAACASTTADDANGDGPSTIPWNRPQSWESGGALGGAMGH
jgi:hypothetical protein